MSGEIVGILLAAGQGSRFGSDKLLHPLHDGTPMARSAAASLLPAVDKVIAVVRPGAEQLTALLAATGCQTVIAAEAEKGMGNSLATAVRAAADSSGWVVALADMPFIAPTSHRAIVASLRHGATLAACAYQQQRGHPVGFAACWFRQLATLSGDSAGKTILKEHRHELRLCPVDDPGVLQDVDRPDDLQRFLLS